MTTPPYRLPLWKRVRSLWRSWRWRNLPWDNVGVTLTEPVPITGRCNEWCQPGDHKRPCHNAPSSLRSDAGE